MKKYYHFKILISVFVAVIIAGFSSCIKSDYEECVNPNGNVRITLSLSEDIASRSSSLDRYQISSTNIYVFDAVTGEYVTSAIGGEYIPNRTYEVYFNLRKNGLYDFIVWTNMGEVYKTNISIGELEATHPYVANMELFMDYASTNLSVDIPDLLYGTPIDAQGNPVSVNIVGNRDNHVEVVLIPNVHDINIKVTGMPSTTDNFEFSIIDNSSRFEFDDNTTIPGTDDFKYTRTCTQNGGELNTSMKVLRLEENRAVEFVFKNATTGDILFSGNLIDIICDAYINAGQPVPDFNVVYTFSIVFSYNTNLGMTVTINGWEYKPETGNLE